MALWRGREGGCAKSSLQCMGFSSCSTQASLVMEMFLLKTVTRPGFFQSARLFVFTLLDLTDIWNYIWVRKNAQFLLFVNNCLSRKSRRFFRHTFRSLLNITKVTEYYKVCWILQKWIEILHFHCCYCLVQLCLTLCVPMDMLGSSVLHCLPEFSQIHVHWVSDAI